MFIDKELHQFYGCLKYSTKAMIIYDKNEAVAVVGVAYHPKNAMMYMDWIGNPKKYQRAIIKASWAMLDKVIEDGHKRLYAIAHDNNTSHCFLSHFGFKPLYGDVYEWVA